MASSKFVLSLIPAILVVSFLTTQAASVFAQESPIINRVEVWGLFYRLMVIAFTVGAVIMGVLAYVIFRFRESNPKNFPRERTEGHA
ncbi:MAG TPA: heme transporter CcmC [Nitrososphaera sp.]|nr:heme transporter CcmC [Nitrososphaera sp.]